MGRLGILELIIIFLIVVGPIAAVLFMTGYQMGKKKGFKQAMEIYQKK